MALMRIKKFWGEIGEARFSPPPSLDGLDVIHYLSVPPTSDIQEQAVPVATWLIDLSMPVTTLQAEMSETTRYEIRRAEEKDQLVFEETLAANKEDLREFAKFFSPLAARKGLPPISLDILLRYSAAGVLHVARARGPDRQVLAAHVHYIDEGRARLLHSATKDSSSGPEKNLVGRANRWLHWREMQTFKQRGIRLYDFGGIYTGSEDKALLQINQFKAMFGGFRENSVNFSKGLSLIGRLYLFLKRCRS